MAHAIKRTSSTTIAVATEEGATAKVVAVNGTDILRLHVGWISQSNLFKSLGPISRRQADALIEALTAVTSETTPGSTS
jgi:hypothetical protein